MPYFISKLCFYLLILLYAMVVLSDVVSCHRSTGVFFLMKPFVLPPRVVSFDVVPRYRSSLATVQQAPHVRPDPLILTR